MAAFDVHETPMQHRPSSEILNRPWAPNFLPSTSKHHWQDTNQLSGNGLEFEHIEDLATEFVPGTQHPSEGYHLLKVYEIYRPNDCQSPLDLVILIGIAMVPLGVLVWCDVGCAALADYLLWPDVGQSIREHIRSIAYQWGARPSSSCRSAVSSSGDRRYIYWGALGNDEGYHYQQLVQSRAGKVLLEASPDSLSEEMTTTAFSMSDFDALQLFPNLSLPARSLRLQKPTTLDCVKARIRSCGARAAWKSIGDLAASNNMDTKRRLEDLAELKIYDFFRPSHYKTPADLLMLVGDTVVPLHDLGQCAVGWTLLQDLFSEQDAVGHQLYTITPKEIRTDVLSWGAQTLSTAPYLTAVSMRCRYIRWKCSSCWERYDLNTLKGTRLGNTLDSLHPSEVKWIEEEDTTVQRTFAPSHVIGIQPSVSSNSLGLCQAVKQICEGYFPSLQPQKSASRSLRADSPNPRAEPQPVFSSCRVTSNVLTHEGSFRPDSEPSPDCNGSLNPTRPLSLVAPGHDLFDTDKDERLCRRWFLRLLSKFSLCSCRR